MQLVEDTIMQFLRLMQVAGKHMDFPPAGWHDNKKCHFHSELVEEWSILVLPFLNLFESEKLFQLLV